MLIEGRTPSNTVKSVAVDANGQLLIAGGGGGGGGGDASLAEQEAQTALLTTIDADTGAVAAALASLATATNQTSTNTKLDTLITQTDGIETQLSGLQQALQQTTLTRYAETQLTAPGSTTTRAMSRGVARIIYTVANINTNVVIRAEGRMHSSEDWFNLSTGDITITANGTYAIFIEQFVTEIRFTFVSESGGTAATIDVSTYV